MIISGWLQQSQARLERAGISTARLDSLVLLEDELGKDRAWLLAHIDLELQRSEIENLSTKITQRLQHVPLAYIRGHAEFYGHEFAVNAHTLVPRPETETMLDLLFRHLRQGPSLTQQVQIVDVGTGSGAIAITAKLNLPQAQIIATDIDKYCLQTARLNAQKLGADITFLHGHLLEPLLANIKQRTINREANKKWAGSPLALNSMLSILLCNLPYVPDNFQINTAATHEPRHALFGGPDGLDLYRELFKQIDATIRKPCYILTESLPTQHEKLTEIALAAGYRLTKTEDFIQFFSSPI